MALDQLIWSSNDHHHFLNSRLPKADHDKLLETFKLSVPKQLKSHIWLTTSGTSGQIKWVGLPKKAFLISAEAVNAHLDVTSSDRWLNILPIFHVGGLSIYARAYLSDSEVVTQSFEKWDSELFSKLVNQSRATLTSLVPAQVFDLVSRKIKAPKSLRAAIIGGGALDELLYEAAVKLGWPLLPSFGMTEACSQIATAPLDSIGSMKLPALKTLSHIDLKLSADGLLMLKGDSLLTGYISNGVFIDPKKSGWFTTEDQVTIIDRSITHVARAYGFIKIGGESVDITRLQRILEQVLLENNMPLEAAVFSYPCQRLGHIINLAVNETLTDQMIQELSLGYNEKVLPFEKIRGIHRLKNIPKTSLGKIRFSEILKHV